MLTTENHLIIIKNLYKSYYKRSIINYIANSKGSHREAPVLKNISFSIIKGESFGIIGENGSGKSTLLQILCGILKNFEGTVVVNGRVTALLELGSGFNPEFTGRENIYLSGVLSGNSFSEMQLKIEEIINFADIGDYIDKPVRIYSTGMLMRVAFAVATSVDPDILIIDEALGVGDILFQQKCHRRIQGLLKKNVTLILVTHDVGTMLALCKKAIWLENGEILYNGDAGSCAKAYLASVAAKSINLYNSTSDNFKINEYHIDIPKVTENLNDKERLGDSNIYISSFVMHNSTGLNTVLNVDQWSDIYLRVCSHIECTDVSAGIELRNRYGHVVFATGLSVIKKLIDKLGPNYSYIVKISFQILLAPGQYTIDIGCGAQSEIGNIWQRILNVTNIEVVNENNKDVIHGLIKLPYAIDVFQSK
jgi:ABC-type dipeptide/oligopeptide/nickel transport system ATPase component